VCVCRGDRGGGGVKNTQTRISTKVLMLSKEEEEKEGFIKTRH